MGWSVIGVVDKEVATLIEQLVYAQLQRWSIVLSAYDYTIEYQPSPRKCRCLVPEDQDHKINIHCLSYCNPLPVTTHVISKATIVDPVLAKVYQYTLNDSLNQSDDVNVKP